MSNSSRLARATLVNLISLSFEVAEAILASAIFACLTLPPEASGQQCGHIFEKTGL